MVSIRRSAVRNEIRIMDIRRLPGECRCMPLARHYYTFYRFSLAPGPGRHRLAPEHAHPNARGTCTSALKFIDTAPSAAGLEPRRTSWRSASIAHPSVPLPLPSTCAGSRAPPPNDIGRARNREIAQSLIECVEAEHTILPENNQKFILCIIYSMAYDSNGIGCAAEWDRARTTSTTAPPPNPAGFATTR